MSEDTFEHVIPSSLNDNTWGIPDWRDPSGYPDPETAYMPQWKWEFLRRSEEYRVDWLTHFTVSWEEWKQDHPDELFETMEENEEGQFGSSEAVGYLDRHFCHVRMPGSIEKYG